MDIVEINTITYDHLVSPQMIKLSYDMVNMIINNIGNDVEKKHGDLFCTEMNIYVYFVIL